MSEKTCFKCHTKKPICEFYRHRMMADGHLNKCKDCTKNDERIRFHKKYKIPDWREKELERCRIKASIARQFGKTASPEAISRGKKAWRDRNKHKIKAHAAINNRLRSGKIERKPCEVCGEIRAHAHHDDYSKPLEVIWLCSEHHGERHVEINKAKRLSSNQHPLAEG